MKTIDRSLAGDPPKPPLVDAVGELPIHGVHQGGGRGKSSAISI